MLHNWSFIILFASLSVLLGIATFLKRMIPLFNRYLIPVSIIAGFLGLIIGPEGLNIIKFNVKDLENIVYHLMAIGFIALALKDRPIRKGNDLPKTAFYIVATYLVQGIIGFGLTLILFYTLFPNLFPPMGLLLPLGYGQGPGQAYSIGSSWEAKGFAFGGNIGLTIATFGYLWALIPGIIILNFLVKKHKMNIETPKESELAFIIEKDEAGDAPISASIDKITIQFFMIGIVYLVTYFTIKGLNDLLYPLGKFGETLAETLWGFQFIFGTIYAIGLRFLFNIFKKSKIMIYNYPNNYLLTRISGASFDFMVTAAICAISIRVFVANYIPILIITTAGGIITYLFCLYFAKYTYRHYTLEYFIALYGMLTGTLSTGLALLREVDANFTTPVAENLVLASGIALPIGFPLLLLLTVPIIGYTTNNPKLYFITLIILVVYLFLMILFLSLLRKKDKNI
ncbi:MAG TPA: sodium/glutamate symporter [Exilispira sp.]|nr:sodium/glutamate symporter [Exilispira sp.]